MTLIVHPYHLDEKQPGFPDERRVADGPVGEDLPERLVSLFAPVADAVAEDLAGGGLPVVLSADCTVAVATIAGAQRVVPDIGVIWFDAHGDLNTPESSPSGYVGGMALAVLTGRTELGIAPSLRLRPVPDSAVVLTDARDLDPPERELLDNNDIAHVSIADVNRFLPDVPLYVHLDCDVIDNDQVPELMFQTPGGVPLDQLRSALESIAATGRVRAVGIAATFESSAMEAGLAMLSEHGLIGDPPAFIQPDRSI